MSKCYVCLEACEFQSPCECKMYIHEHCLLQSHSKMPRNDCSICHSPIRIESIEINISPPSEIHVDTERKYAYPCVLVVYAVLIYLILGWIGKLILVFCGLQLNVTIFWNWEHLVSFIVTFLVLTIIISLCANSSLDIYRD